MSNEALTPRQQQILDLIRRHLERTGRPPTRAEIAETFGFRSINAAEQHLRALARKAVIELLPGTSRGIRLLTPNPETMDEMVGELAGLPLIGRVAAGSPILAAEHIERRYAIDPELFRPKPHYLLRVRGLSMRDAGILDGDLLAVHGTPEATDGQIVVARIDDEVTVKRLRRDPRHPHLVRLQAENPDFAPIEVDLRVRELVIEGLGVGLLRGLGLESLS